MLRKLLWISIVIWALLLLFLGLRWVWSTGGIFGNWEIDLISDEQQTITRVDDVLEGKAELIPDVSTTQTTWDHQSAPSVVTVTMPGWFFNDAWQVFFDRMEKEHNTTIRFVHPGSIGEYNDSISDDLAGSDIALVPSDWRNLYQDSMARVRIPSDMFWAVHPERQDLFQHDQWTFFPYLLDPPVLFHSLKWNPTWDELTTYALLNPEKHSFAVWWWRDSISQELWKKWGELLPWHASIWSRIIDDSLSFVSPKRREAFVSLITSNNSWDTLRLRSWSTNQNDPYCIDHLVGCLFAYYETSASLGYLSQLSAWRTYYPWFSRDWLNLSPIPSWWFSYPSRWRWWVVNSDSNVHNEVLAIMEDYLVWANAQQYAFWSHEMLSPFVSWNSLQRQKNSLSELKHLRNRRTIVTEQQWEYLADDRLIDVMEGTYDPLLYLSQ